MARALGKLFPTEVIWDVGAHPDAGPLLTRTHVTPDFSKIRGLRWLRWLGQVVVHNFIRADCDRHMHDHARYILSWCVRGHYVEYCRRIDGTHDWRFHRAGQVRLLRSDHAHRVVAVSHGGCRTICWFGPNVRAWGFWVEDRWVPWREYVS